MILVSMGNSVQMFWWHVLLIGLGRNMILAHCPRAVVQWLLICVSIVSCCIVCESLDIRQILICNVYCGWFILLWLCTDSLLCSIVLRKTESQNISGIPSPLSVCVEYFRNVFVITRTLSFTLRDEPFDSADMFVSACGVQSSNCILHCLLMCSNRPSPRICCAINPHAW